MTQNLERVLEVSNLTKVYEPTFFARMFRSKQPFTAVNGISFDLKKGEILGFLGPNGSGKSTTMHMLLDSLKPTSGTISYFNQPFNQHTRSSLLRGVSFMSTYVGLPKRLSIKEALLLYGGLYGIPHKKLTRIVDEIMHRFGLYRLRNREIANLSAGQTSQVMLAKAYVSQPKVVLLDEPTAALDPDVAAEIRNFIWDYTKEYGTSVLFASHNMDEVTQMCDRVIVLQNGVIIESDTPDNLIGRIEIAHVLLLMGTDLEKMILYCNQQKLSYRMENKYIDIEIEEKKIATLLQDISQLGIVYTHISITKPTLEDYFIQVSRASVKKGVAQ